MKLNSIPATVLSILFVGASVCLASSGAVEDEKLKLAADWLDKFQVRSLGPAAMGGRCVAIAVSAKDTSKYWIATASGGLLKTTNAGMTYEHQFDQESSVSIGHVAVAPSNDDILWVGTGEANPRNSVSYGDGVYKSEDGGKTWKRMGLEKSYQIGRIAIHPENPDIVYIGALGRLYGPNEERGLFKTEDGGKNWKKVLYIDERTGVVDVDMHPTDSQIVTVATYERERDGFDTNAPAKTWGPGSGVYRTKDGGQTWIKLTNGLPTVELGRIGIDYSRQNPNVLFAIVESERIGRLPEDAAFMGMSGEDADVGARITNLTKEGPAEKAGFKEGDIVLAMGEHRILGYDDLLVTIRGYKAGDKVQVELVRERELTQVEIEFATYESDSRGLSPFASFLGGQRENVQDTQGPDGWQTGGIYKSTDGGDTWQKINSLNPRPMYYSQIRVDPSDENMIYVLGTSFWKSIDGAKTFESVRFDEGVHVDHHAMWIDPSDGRHMILGNDGGIYVSHDRTANWDHHNHMAIGQFYHAAMDRRPLYNVYGGLQDNGSWGGPNRTRERSGTVNADWFNVGGGDGFVCRVDPNDVDQIYSESQGGAMGWRNLRTGERGGARPGAQRGFSYRFNWETPFLLSKHNSRVLYSAGNYVFRSLDRGRDGVMISPEITLTDRGTATALAESQHEPNVLWVGTDDGALWLTRDGGANWTDLRLEPPVDGVNDPAERRSSLLLALVTALDGDGDGVVTKNEVPDRLAEVFATADTDGDGKLSAYETSLMTGAAPGPARDALDGKWKVTVAGDAVPPVGSEFTIELKRGEEERRTGTLESEKHKGSLGNLRYDEEAQTLDFTFKAEGVVLKFSSKIAGEAMTGTLTIETGGFKANFEAQRQAPESDKKQESDEKAEPEAKSEPGEKPPSEEKAEPAETPKSDEKPQSDDKKADDKKKPKKARKAGPTFAELVPKPMWITGLEASHHKSGRIYVAVDGHRSDDDAPYAFASEDFGISWRSITKGLPRGSVRVIREDLVNENVLYIGTEFNGWISIDRGNSWTKMKELPTVAIHEFAQETTTGDVLVATHGRSLWAFDATTLRQLNADVVKADAHLYAPGKVIRWRSTPSRATSGTRRFVGQNPEGGAHLYYSLGSRVRSVKLSILGLGGATVYTFSDEDVDRKSGMHHLNWNMRMAPDPNEVQQQGRRRFRGGRSVPNGTYQVLLEVDGLRYTQPLVIEGDPDFPEDSSNGEEEEEEDEEHEREYEIYEYKGPR